MTPHDARALRMHAVRWLFQWHFIHTRKWRPF